MKKYIFAVVAIVLFISVSCKKEQVINPPVDIPEGSFLVKIGNSANPQKAPRVEDGMATKTTIDNNRCVIWEVGDIIHINGKPYTTSTSGESVIFSPVNANDPATGDDFVAFYGVENPANGTASAVLPETQIYNEGKVSNLPMYATCGSNHELTFHNICAAFFITVPVKCAKIKLTASEPLSGGFAISEDSGKPVASMSNSDTHNYVELVKSSGKMFDAGEKVYLAVPQGNYTNGQIMFMVDDGVAIESKEVGSFSTAVNKIYNVSVTPYPELCFTALEGTIVAMLRTNENAPTVQLQYRLYKPSAETNRLGNWTDFTFGGVGVTLAKGEKIYIRAKSTNTTFAYNTDYYHFFSSSHNVSVSGNIMYLLDGTSPATVLSSANNRAFYKLFINMTNLKDASGLILPATSLSDYCYTSMFNGCTNLTSAPALPATTLSDYCYASMFYKCSSLTSAPELRATSLSDYCYASMFCDCASLASAPELSATTLNDYCYESMFCRCSSLTSAPELSASTLKDHCYANMFNGCSSLVNAPALPATALNRFCYKSMFGGCTSLTNAPALPATTLSDNCYESMFGGCASLTSAPELPASTLVDNCYNQMFRSCTNLSSVVLKATSVSATQCLNSWLDGAGTSSGDSHILYVDKTMVSHGTIKANKGNFTIQAYN